MDINFLKSNRFWALVVAAIVGVLKSEGILDDGVSNALIGLALGFVGVRSLDRFSETIK